MSFESFVEGIVRNGGSGPIAQELLLETANVHCAACAPSIVELGNSRFGGAPDVPSGFSWPTLKGQPLLFVAQLHGNDLKTVLPLAPDVHSLLFFVGRSFEVGRVLSIQGQPCQLFRQECSTASCASQRWARAEFCVSKMVPFDAPDELHGVDYRELVRSHGIETEFDCHRIGGYPSNLQDLDEFLEECSEDAQVSPRIS